MMNKQYHGGRFLAISSCTCLPFGVVDVVALSTTILLQYIHVVEPRKMGFCYYFVLKWLMTCLASYVQENSTGTGGYIS